MLTPIETLHNVASSTDASRICRHFARYKQGTAELCVIGDINKSSISDILYFKDFERGMRIEFHNGFMIRLIELQGNTVTESDLFLRHSAECIGDLELVRHAWKYEYETIFQIDTHLQANPNRVSEMFVPYAEFRHGPTYHLLGLKLEELTVRSFQKVLSVEKQPKFREYIIKRLEDYAVGDYNRGEGDLTERISAIRLLEHLGEEDATKRTKRLVFKKHSVQGRFIHARSRSISVPEPETYSKLFTFWKSFDEF